MKGRKIIFIISFFLVVFFLSFVDITFIGFFFFLYLCIFVFAFEYLYTNTNSYFFLFLHLNSCLSCGQKGRWCLFIQLQNYTRKWERDRQRKKDYKKKQNFFLQFLKKNFFPPTARKKMDVLWWRIGYPQNYTKGRWNFFVVFFSFFLVFCVGEVFRRHFEQFMVFVQ